MQYERPIVISIAGFDPSGGAGVLADVKTLEQHNCLGMAVVSALTAQTEREFISVNWLSSEKIVEQLKPLLQTYSCSVIKIGIIENLRTLSSVVNYVHSTNKDIKIVWDPVLSASAGFDLVNTIDRKELEKVLTSVFLITPNTNEALKLSGLSEEQKAAEWISHYCSVLLKGGHSSHIKGRDVLFLQNQKIEFESSPGNYYVKHGSGCILSSAIAANLALGKNAEEACRNAKYYIEKILSSNQHLLAYHVS